MNIDPQTIQQSDISADGFIELERWYLLAIAKALEAQRYMPVMQLLGPRVGRMWIIPSDTGTTVPLACIQFEFSVDAVAFRIDFRDGRPKWEQAFSYAGGIDELGAILTRQIQANRLGYAGKRAVRA